MIKILMILTGIATVMITTLVLTSRVMDVWMLHRGKGEACECGIRSWDEIWDEADTVFSGRVLTVAAPPGPETAAGDAGAVTFIVERVWKDIPLQPIDPANPANPIQPIKEGLPVVMRQPTRPGCLPMRYTTGSPYLILASRQANGIVNDPCGANRRWTRLDELFLSLGIGEPPGPPVIAPSQVRGPMLLATMLFSALVVALISYLGRDTDEPITG